MSPLPVPLLVGVAHEKQFRRLALWLVEEGDLVRTVLFKFTFGVAHEGPRFAIREFAGM